MIRSDKTPVVRKSSQNQRRAVHNYRKRILAGFRALGHGDDARTARLKMQAFYRASGAEWARCLS